MAVKGTGTAAILQALVVLTTAWATQGWNPDAGVVTSFTKMAAAKVTATSNQGEANKAVDGNDNSQWTSSNCLPSAFLGETLNNPLLHACQLGECSASGTSDVIARATDGNMDTQVAIQAIAGKASFLITLPTPTHIETLTLRGMFDGGVKVDVVAGGVHHTIANLQANDDYHTIKLNVSGQAVTSLELTSGAGFLLWEVAAMPQHGCVERLVVDFGTVQEVAFVRTRHWAGDATSSSFLLTSVDGSTWQVAVTLNPNSPDAVENRIQPPRHVRYLAVEHHLQEKDWTHCYVWEVDAWGSSSRFGPSPMPRPNTASLAKMFGVNGIWGWGHRVASTALKPGEGAALYAQVASHGRSYHNLDWDITKPGDRANYEKMAQGQGTTSISWINWDTEYGEWVKANLSVDASIQFSESRFKAATWTSPVEQAHTYGQDFAKHFGPSGIHLVDAVEVGNEPWDFTADLYNKILLGMAKGLKDGDPKIVVAPGAFQAHDPSSKDNYIGPRVTTESASYIDVINGHYYSFFYRPDGTRITVHPEHPGSEFNGVRNLVRWRDANVPSKPVWVTEWGWDSPGAGQDCPFSECVSENSATLYGVRGLLLLARYGVERASWFFYANLDKTECPLDKLHIFCRSGLTGSSETNFAKKDVFLVFRHLFDLMGDKHFLGVVREDADVYAYLFGDPQHGGGRTPWATHMVAWRPVDGDDKTAMTVQLCLRATPLHAWRLTSNRAGPTVTPVPTHQADKWTLEVTSEPLIIEIAGVVPSSTVPVG